MLHFSASAAAAEKKMPQLKWYDLSLKVANFMLVHGIELVCGWMSLAAAMNFLLSCVKGERREKKQNLKRNKSIKWRMVDKIWTHRKSIQNISKKKQKNKIHPNFCVLFIWFDSLCCAKLTMLPLILRSSPYPLLLFIIYSPFCWF